MSPNGETPGVSRDIDGYCRHTRGVAASEAALLRAPEVFGSVGHFSAVGTDLDPAAGIQTTRLLAGLRYDVAELVQGNLLVARAEAECRRYMAIDRLARVLEEGGESTVGPALAAKAAILRNLLPGLHQRIQVLRTEVSEARATIADLQAFRIRVDDLQAGAAQVEIQLAKWQGEKAPRPAPLPELMEEYQRADDEVERIEGRLRRVRAFGVELKGGYEELLGTSQGVPLFGLVTLSYNLGHLWQGAANSKAREGRMNWRQERTGDPGNIRIDEAIRRLRALRDAERKRIEDVRVLAKDLQEQLREVESIETKKVSRYRDFLWVESARLEAEEVYLESHLAELERFLGTVGENL